MRNPGTRIGQPATMTAILMTLIVLGVGMALSEGHQDPCHRQHSCPSDHQTYICGDKGRCDQCPDNQYCLVGKPRMAASPGPAPVLPSRPLLSHQPPVGQPCASPQAGTVPI